MNAIILAAGTSSRFVPLSYEKPKGLLVVKGEVLIERQIRQLLAAGVTGITVVVGYMAGMFSYLEEKYGVKIIRNDDYYRYNNISSILLAAGDLEDTFICCSDNYFPGNVFLEKPAGSFYSALFAEGYTSEYCLSLDGEDRIAGVKAGGENCWYMAGPAFLSREFSSRFREFLVRDYEQEEARQLYWEDIFIRHIDALPPVKIRRFQAGEIEEFDSLEDLRLFDASYVNHTGSKVFGNICKVLSCEERDIVGISVLKKGMTNDSFVFTYAKDGRKYVYRHPGAGTSAFINRQNEAYALQLAKKLGLDSSFVYMHGTEGWKISLFKEKAVTLDAATIQQEINLLGIARLYKLLHNAPVSFKNRFDLFEEIDRYDRLIEAEGARMYEGWDELKSGMALVRRCLESEPAALRPCHNDAVPQNFIKDEDGRIDLLDWEYSGMNDPVAEIASLFLESGFTQESQRLFLGAYYPGGVPGHVEAHILCYKILWDALWAQWTVLKEAYGAHFGSYGRERYTRARKNYEALIAGNGQA